jgi:hypothetical protein
VDDYEEDAQVVDIDVVISSNDHKKEAPLVESKPELLVLESLRTDYA